MKRHSDRLAGLVVTILLQVIFIALFLQRPHLGPPPRDLARELTLILPRLNPIPEKAAAPRAVAPPLLQAPQMPDIVAVPPPAAAPPATANVQGFGKSLFGCAPEHLDMLTPQDRARCGLGFASPGGTAMTELPSQVKDPARRTAELAERNKPARVPCVSMKTQGIGFDGHEDTTFMADPVCVINGMLNGFHLTGLPP